MSIRKGSKTIAGAPLESVWGTISGNIADQEDLKNLLDGKADVSSAELVGTPTAPTPPIGSYNDRIATTKFVSDSIGSAGIIPPQQGHGGEFLSTDGESAFWAVVDTFPEQEGQSGKFLTTNGTSVSWSNVDLSGKVDKVTSTSSKNRVYIVTPAGEQSVLDTEQTGQTASTIPIRTGTGTIRTATPSDNNDAVNLSYLNTQLNTKLSKLTYEWNKEISFGSTGSLCIGKFCCYDSNITVDINATTSTTYHGTLVIATQNIGTASGGLLVSKVYDDASNTITPNIHIYKHPTGDCMIEVYFTPLPWSKNLIHIRAVTLNKDHGSVSYDSVYSDICTNVESVPVEATIVPQNALDTKQDALVSGTNIKTINNNSLLGSGNITIDSLPSQSGNNGKFLTTNGTTASWATVDALPTQTGQSGKFLTTDGTYASWATVDAFPAQSGQNGKFLTTNGSTVSWANAPTEIPSQSGNSGKFLTTNGSSVSWADINALKNNSTGNYSLSILGTSSHAYETIIGSGTSSSNAGTVVVGANASAVGADSTALGYNAHTNAASAIQIGEGTNSSAATLSIGFGESSGTVRNYTLLIGSSGKIPDERLNNPIPSQSGQSGKYLTTDGSSISWASVPSNLPSQSGQSGKYLTTNGSSASWASISIPSVDQTYDGTSANAQSGIAVKSAIDSAISSVYKPAGSVEFANLPTLGSTYEGYVYNVSDDFTTTADFVEGAGHNYPAGTNVVCVNTATSGTAVYKWDVLAGFIDLSGYVKKDGAGSQQTIQLTSGTGTTAFGVKSRATSSYISFSGTGGWLGSYGVTSEKKPTFYNGTSYTLAYVENTVASNTAITGATKCKITYDSKGLVTAGADLAASDIPDISGTYQTVISDLETIRSGASAGATALQPNTAITAATKCKITYDAHGLVTAGADLTANDIPSITLSKISDVTATATELNYVDGVTSSIQTQLNSKATDSAVVHLAGAETITGVKSFNETLQLKNNLSFRSYGTNDSGRLQFRAQPSDNVIRGTVAITDGYTTTGSGYTGFVAQMVARAGSTSSNPFNTMRVSNKGIEYIKEANDGTITGQYVVVDSDGLIPSDRLATSGSTGQVLTKTASGQSWQTIDLSGYQTTITGAATTITSSNLTASKALVSNSSGKVAVSSVTSTELGYLSGVTSAIQTQLGNKQATLVSGTNIKTINNQSILGSGNIDIQGGGTTVEAYTAAEVQTIWDSVTPT